MYNVRKIIGLVCNREKYNHDFEISLNGIYSIKWRRKWKPTPVFLPGKSHRQRSLADYHPWGCKELDTTETTWHLHSIKILNHYVVSQSKYSNVNQLYPS